MKQNILIALAVGVTSLCFNLYQVPRTSFNPDEGRWLHRAHYVREFFDPFGPTWADQYMTRGQPPLGSYLTGLGLLLQGHDLTTNGPWNFGYPGTAWWERNIAEGNMPSAADLTAGRRTSAGLVALTVVAVFALGTLVSNRVGGAIAACFLAVHPFSSYLGSIATSDALLGLLIVLAAFAAVRLARRPTWGNALLLGVLLGLGGATKLSPLFVSVPFAALGAVMLAFGRRRCRPHGGLPPAPDRLAWHFLALPLIAALTFVAVYPYLWLDPIGRTRLLFDFRIEEMHAQSTDWPVMAVPSRAEALRRVGENFDERFSIAGRVAATFGSVVGGDRRPPAVELSLAVIGAELLVAFAIMGGVRGPHAMALLVLGGQVAVTILGMRSEFDRYHVPMAIAAAICIGLVAGTIADRIPLPARSTEGRRRARLAANGKESRRVGADQDRMADPGQPVGRGHDRLPATRQA